jgi:aminoglycoside 6'-N-acetyltransferase
VASAAVALLVPALHQAGIRRIVAKTFADNIASIRVLTKNGFRLEGTERAAVIGRDGRWLDDCTLAHLP